MARVNLTETTWQLGERKRENLAKLASNATIVQGITGKDFWKVMLPKFPESKKTEGWWASNMERVLRKKPDK